jgi:hypothetical protein
MSWQGDVTPPGVNKGAQPGTSDGVKRPALAMLQLRRSTQRAAEAHSRLRTKGKDTMRIILFLTGDRLGSRYLMLGVETLLAMTLCLLLIRTAAQL